VVAEGLKSTLKVLLKHARTDDFLSFLTLWACLGVVLAHVLIVGGAETDDALSSLVTNVDTDEHGLPGDLLAEVQAPEVSTELGVDLSENVDVYSIIVLADGLAGDELGDDGAVCVDLVLQSRIEVLLLDAVWHDDEEEEQVFIVALGGSSELLSIGVLPAHELQVVVVNGFLECLDSRPVVELDDVTVVDVDVELALL